MRRAALLLAFLAAGCAMVDRIAPTSESARPVPASAPASPSSESLMSYLGRLRTMNEAALNTEAARMKRIPAGRFGTPEELRPIISRLDPSADLYVVGDGDHSFKVPKRSDVTQGDVHRAMTTSPRGCASRSLSR